MSSPPKRPCPHGPSPLTQLPVDCIIRILKNYVVLRSPSMSEEYENRGVTDEEELKEIWRWDEDTVLEFYGKFPHDPNRVFQVLFHVDFRDDPSWINLPRKHKSRSIEGRIAAFHSIPRLSTILVSKTHIDRIERCFKGKTFSWVDEPRPGLGLISKRVETRLNTGQFGWYKSLFEWQSRRYWTSFLDLRAERLVWATVDWTYINYLGYHGYTWEKRVHSYHPTKKKFVVKHFGYDIVDQERKKLMSKAPLVSKASEGMAKNWKLIDYCADQWRDGETKMRKTSISRDPYGIILFDQHGADFADSYRTSVWDHGVDASGNVEREHISNEDSDRVPWAVFHE